DYKQIIDFLSSAVNRACPLSDPGRLCLIGTLGVRYRRCWMPAYRLTVFRSGGTDRQITGWDGQVSKTGKSLTESVYLSLRDDMLTYRIKPATKLNIASLASARGVSLSAVREALARLSSEGFVIPEPRRGFRVASVSREDLLDLTEQRVAIEGQCLQRSIQHGDVAWEGRILASLHELSRTPARNDEGFNPAWISSHTRFHSALVEACDTPWLMRIRELLYSHSERYRVLSSHIDRSHLDTEHHDIAEATIARDTARAVDLLTEHIRLTARIILENDAKRSVSFFAGESAEDEKSLAGDPAEEDVFEG